MRFPGTVGMQTALKLGRISAPIIFAMQRDQRLKELLATRLTNKEDVAPGVEYVSPLEVRRMNYREFVVTDS